MHQKGKSSITSSSISIPPLKLFQLPLIKHFQQISPCTAIVLDKRDTPLIKLIKQQPKLQHMLLAFEVETTFHALTTGNKTQLVGHAIRITARDHRAIIDIHATIGLYI